MEIINPELLMPFCSIDSTRPNLGKPYQIEADGDSYAVGTEGHIACLMHGTLADVGPSDAPRDPAFWRETLRLDREWATGQMSDLVAFAALLSGVSPQPKEEICQECYGDGFVECECECGDEHDRRCDCGAKPGIAYPRFTPMLFYGFECNAQYIRKLAALPGDSFQFAICGDQIFIKGDEWFVTIMRLRFSPQLPEYTFPLAEA